MSNDDNKTNREKWRELNKRMIAPADYGDPEKPAPTFAERFAPRKPPERKAPDATHQLSLTPTGAGFERE
jgi:hypothetical protein